MSDRIHFDSIGRSITVSMNVDSLSDRDKITLLHHLMCQFDPREGDGNEAYQNACNVVLQEANKMWDKPVIGRQVAPPEHMLTCHKCRHQQPRVHKVTEQICKQCGSTEVWI